MNGTDGNESVMAELPKYKCHKVVWALKIEAIILDSETAEIEGRETNGGADLRPENRNYLPIFVDAEYVRKHKPIAGGYYVVYDGGYKSFSPAEAFESGYTKL